LPEGITQIGRRDLKRDCAARSTLDPYDVAAAGLAHATRESGLHTAEFAERGFQVRLFVLIRRHRSEPLGRDGDASEGVLQTV
jgi:hypothetical protein